MFKICPDYQTNRGKGFAMTFSNGFTISVQFGNGNYCENQNHLEVDNQGMTICNSAEIALWDSKGEFVTKNAMQDILGEDEFYDSVKGWCKTDEVANYILWAATHP